jgi:hypothetical protein
LIHPYSWREWFALHDKWMKEPPAVLKQGARLTEKVVVLNMANKIEWTVVSIEGRSHLLLAGTGMAAVRAELRFTIEPGVAGSRFTVTADFKGALIDDALGKAIELDGLRQLEKSLDQLNALVSAPVR